jgi:hypothetical protein
MSFTSSKKKIALKSEEVAVGLLFVSRKTSKLEKASSLELTRMRRFTVANLQSLKSSKWSCLFSTELLEWFRKIIFS